MIPNPREIYPLKHHNKLVFLNNIINEPNISIGDYTYYDDLNDANNFIKNVLYHFPFIGDKLIIGKFCAIASGVRFIMGGANHKMSGFSTFPFNIFGGDWSKVNSEINEFPLKGDTIISNDVWIGYNALIMPGVKIGNGAIIAAESVVTTDVKDYSIVGGNPAKEIKKRYSENTINRLLKIAWWDWSIEKITRNLELIVNANIKIEDLENAQ